MYRTCICYIICPCTYFVLCPETQQVFHWNFLLPEFYSQGRTITKITFLPPSTYITNLTFNHELKGCNSFLRTENKTQGKWSTKPLYQWPCMSGEEYKKYLCRMLCQSSMKGDSLITFFRMLSFLPVKMSSSLLFCNKP